MAMVREEYAEPESFGRLLSSIDAAWIEEALEATGTATIRKRRLPAEQVVWLVLGLALYRDWSISRVVNHLHLALPGESGRGVVPSASIQARARLGDEPMRWLFERCAQSWAHASADRHRYRGLALYGVDGTTVRTLDSAENRAHFGGQSGGDRGASGYPQARLVTLMALRSHLLAAARFGPYAVGETTMAEELWPELPDDSLCIVDREFLAVRCLSAIEDQDRNRHWMTRAKSRSRWRTVKRLGRGDELVELEFSDQTRRATPEMPARWLPAADAAHLAPRPQEIPRPRNGRALSRALGAGARLRRGQDRAARARGSAAQQDSARRRAGSLEPRAPLQSRPPGDGADRRRGRRAAHPHQLHCRATVHPELLAHLRRHGPGPHPA